LLKLRIPVHVGVARPPVRLLMTWSLNACRRPADSTSLSAAPVRHQTLGPYPLSSHARKPKMLKKTMNSATRSCGRESAPTTTGSAGVPEMRARTRHYHRAQHATIMPVRRD
jgi:hypothetical protein